MKRILLLVLCLASIHIIECAYPVPHNQQVYRARRTTEQQELACSAVAACTLGGIFGYKALYAPSTTTFCLTVPTPLLCCSIGFCLCKALHEQEPAETRNANKKETINGCQSADNQAKNDRVKQEKEAHAYYARVHENAMQRD